MLEIYLKKHFNYEHFRTGQKEVITSVLEGNHTLAMLPTGTGKSLCYQLSGYILKGHVLIVSPLLSLMQDQVEQMKMNGEKSVVAINSFLSGAERKRVLSNIRQYKFIFVSPETLANEKMVNMLKRLNISLFVIDEAHCISQWGYDFRPDYIKLGDVRKSLNHPLTLALTATATVAVRNDIIKSLKLEECKQIVFSVDRPNIAMSVVQMKGYQEKWENLYQMVANLAGPGIVYFSSKKVAEQAVSFLNQKGIERVAAYHGGMDQESRILIQQQFLLNQLDIICATSAFGMGVNKENIRFVIHFHMPQNVESYLQEIGRAGRDGLMSIAILFYAPFDEQLAYRLADLEVPSSEQLDWLVHTIQDSEVQWVQEPEVLQKMGGFTETSWRMISDILIHHTGSNSNLITNLIDYKSTVEKRQEMKKNKIAFMTNWILSKECRRKPLLQYFNEEIDEVCHELCCDSCGIELSHFHHRRQEMKNEVEFSWKQRLSDILLK